MLAKLGNLEIQEVSLDPPSQSQCKERVCTPNKSLLTHWQIQWAKTKGKNKKTWSFAKFSEAIDLHQFHTYSYNSEHFWRGMWRRSLRTLQKWTRCWRSNTLFIWEHSLFHWARPGLWAGIMIQTHHSLNL